MVLVMALAELLVAASSGASALIQPLAMVNPETLMFNALVAAYFATLSRGFCTQVRQ